MSRGLVALIVLATPACAKVELPPEQGTACSSNIVLDGTMGGTTIDLDLGSTDVCMQLDATQNLDAAHLMVNVDGIGFQSTLVDLDNVVLREGWDLETFDRIGIHTLEWTLPAGETRDVVLHVERMGTHAPARLTISLFEPFE